MNIYPGFNVFVVVNKWIYDANFFFSLFKGRERNEKKPKKLTNIPKRTVQINTLGFQLAKNEK